jgi:lipopolysaccharide/colanic/teichoic acid biosynthesis glycosyltransferase
MFQPTRALIGNALLPSGEYTLVPISYAEIAGAAIVGWRGVVKRAMDIIVASLLLVGWAVPMLVMAWAIHRGSPGPVLFRQRRMGYGNQPFVLFKFRTMYHDAAASPDICQATPDDKRITPVGALLRRSSLDELPQLFNVLRGEMSMVGPRPHAPGTRAGSHLFEQVTPFYAARHRVRPGITGLAQVRGLRGATETEEKLMRRIAADLEYIQTWSPWLDVVIMVRTAGAMLTMRNAY